MKDTTSSKKRRRGFSAVPFLGDLVVFTRLLRDRDAHWALKLVTLATLAYVISPIDALPEAIAPMIGWIDDFGIVIAVRFLLERPLAKYRYPLFGKAASASEADRGSADAALPGQFASGYSVASRG